MVVGLVLSQLGADSAESTCWGKDMHKAQRKLVQDLASLRLWGLVLLVVVYLFNKMKGIIHMHMGAQAHALQVCESTQQ